MRARILDELNSGEHAGWGMAVGLGLAGAILWIVTLGGGFFGDEWFWLIYRQDFTVDGVLAPYNGSFNAAPFLVFQGVAHSLGSDYLPFKFLFIGFDLLVALLLYLYLRSRINPWLAVAFAIVVPLFGAGWHVLVSSGAGTVYTMSVVAGLGALLALDRRSTLGDVAACLLLVVAVASHSSGVAFTFACAAAILILPTPARWTRSWTWIVPLVAYVTWSLWAGAEYPDSNPAEFKNLTEVPRVAFESLSAVFAGLLGMLEFVAGGNIWIIRDDIGMPFAALFIVIFVYAFVRARLRPEALTGLTLALAFWCAVAIVLSEVRQPTDSRYVWVALVVLAVAAGALIPKGPLPGIAWMVIGIALVVGLVPNLRALADGADAAEVNSRTIRSILTAIEISRDEIDPGFVPSEQPAATVIGGLHLPAKAGDYLDAIDERESLSYSEDELLDAGYWPRLMADVTLARALRLRLDPAAAGAARDARCRTLDPDRDRFEEVPPGGSIMITAGPEGRVKVSAGRFSEEPVRPLGRVRAGKTARLSIPDDSASRPWLLRLASDEPFSLCTEPRG